MTDTLTALVIGIVAIVLMILLGLICVLLIERMRIRAAREIANDSLKQIFKDSGIKLKNLEK